MRTRLLWVIVALVSLALAPSVAGCASGEATSPGQGSPAAWESTLGVPAPGYDTVDVDGAFQAVTSDESARLVDVREPAEWAETGVPEGAALIPLGDLESRAAELAADSPIYVICRSGNRSRTASDILIGLGFTQVYNVDGGVTAWVEAGLPMEPYQP